MSYQRPVSPAPRPAGFGCFALAAGATLALAFATLAVLFLDSGADDGKLVLDDADSYAPGSVEFAAQRNFYLVRLGQGDYYALADLDAANRAAPQRRCRVAPIPASDPALPGLLASYGSRLSARAAGSTLLFREGCNGAVYDVTGVRLDAEAPNLDRYPVSIRSDGRLVIDVRKRTCSERRGGNVAAPVACR